MPSTSSELRLFISSTFQDLSEERGYLMKHVFPKLRTLCRERGVEFTEIDLRWGLTAEESSMGRVIRSCIEEIERCRPYFLGIIGDRYGWVPPLPEVQKDFQLVERYPWIEEAAIDGASIVEIEFISGILADPASVRLPIYSKRSKNGEEVGKLLQLEERLQEAGVPITYFEGVEALGQAVFTDLLDVIERDWPEVEIATELDRERRLHEVFAANRRKAYIANAAYYRELMSFASAASADAQEGTADRLIIHGNSGLGKSALAAYFVEQWKKKNRDAFVVAHYVGASPSGSDAYTILRHIYEEIRERYALTERLPETREELSAQLPEWLTRVQQEMLIVIDAVNQLPDPDDLLGWLPEYLPPKVRLIVTTTETPLVNKLRTANWRALQLGPLDVHEREALIVRFLGEYHKGLNPPQLRLLTAHKNTSSPLFLRTLLEELRITADFELLDQSIEHYLSARDINELFQFVLERLENDYGRELVADVMSYICASREGLSENELIELTGVERSALSELLIALDFHLMKPNARYTFFHDYLRAAVTTRYLANPVIARKRHRELAQYFDTLPPTLHNVEEVLWQWSSTGDDAKMLAAISDLHVLDLFTQQHAIGKLHSLWKSIGDLSTEYVKRLDVARKAGTARPLDLINVAELLQLNGAYETAYSLLGSALDMLGSDAVNSKLRLRAMLAIGSVLRVQGQYEAAEKHFRDLLTLTQQDAQCTTYDVAQALRSLAEVLYERKKYTEAEELVRQCIEIHEAAFGVVDREVVEDLSLLGVILADAGKTREGEEILLRAMRLAERFAHRDTSYVSILNNVGALYYFEGDHPKSVQYFRDAANLNRELLGPNNPATLQNLSNLAALLQQTGELEEAEKIFTSCLPIFAAKFGEGPETQNLKGNYAILLSVQGRYEAADKLLNEVLDHMATLYGDSHFITLYAHLRIAKNWLNAGQVERAKCIYETYLPQLEAAAGVDHPVAVRSRADYERLLQAAIEP